MIKEYYADGYERVCEATIEKIDGPNVYFDRTIFYPEGGGQPGDRGKFGQFEIVNTEKDGSEVFHIFKSTEGLKVGDSAMLELDWSHRYSFMKRHSAQHLLSSVFYKELSIGTVAVHLANEYVTIELDKKEVSKEDLLLVESVANSLVRKALKIEQKDLKREDALSLHMRRSIKVDDEVVKVVFIEGQDAVACGGVHVRNTSEIGEISYYDSEILRGHLRTIWKIDDAAVKERRQNLDQIKEASILLSSPNDGVVKELKARLNELEDLRREVRALKADAARKEALAINEDYKVYITEYPLDEFRAVLTKDNGKKEVLIVKKGAKMEFLYIGSEEHFSTLKNSLSLKGGGRGGIYQGSFDPSLLEKAKELIYGFKG